MARHVARRYPLLGTVVEVVVTGGTEANARAMTETAVAEIERLSAILDAFDSRSELSAWKRDEVDDPSGDLCAVMAAALDWQGRSGGSFNPLVGELSAVWSAAEDDGELPSPEHLSEVAASIQAPRYAMHSGKPVRLVDCSRLNFNAIAKGYIVDRAVAAASHHDDVVSVVVSAGGDLAHRGAAPSRLGIENPHRPYDNEPPVAFVELCEGGLATSGDARRGYNIDGQWFSHVLDPHTGQPVRTHASISVIAPSAMEADVLATVAGALPVGESIGYVEALPDVGCLIVGLDGGLLSDATWEQRALQ